MKKLLFFVLIFIAGCASVDLRETASIINAPGMSKFQVYQKSRQWLIYKFRSEYMVRYEDPDMGRIIFKHWVSLGTFFTTIQLVNLIITVDSANGKAKITIAPENCGAMNAMSRVKLDCPCSTAYLTSSALNNIGPAINGFINDYREYMAGGSTPAWDGK